MSTETERTSTSYAVELSTTVEPAPLFTLDGAEYKILTFKHLSAEDEAKVEGMLSRYDRQNQALQLTGSDSEANSLAKKLRQRRIDLICMLTTLPRELATTLPLPLQSELMDAIQRELNPSANED